VLAGLQGIHVRLKKVIGACAVLAGPPVPGEDLEPLEGFSLNILLASDR
jgi:hypothetical protein